MQTSLQRLPDQTLELTLAVPWSRVSKVYEEVLDELVKNTQLPGFRKGKAPRKLVEEKADKTRTYEEVLKRLIPQIYSEAIGELKLHPITTPKIELKQATEGKDWIIRALTCEKPEVTLGDYKSKIVELKAGKQKKIWVPGQTEPKSAEAEKEQKVTLDEILTSLYQVITVNLPALLVEQEVNRLLSELIDQTRKLGISVEQYLASTGRTAESLRREYQEQAKRQLSLEFALETIADQESILVSDDDIDNLIKNAKTAAEREALTNQRYYLATLLRRQKTLDFLVSL
ncbi:MAG: trigger factor [Patescibacteria group bacterium]